MRPSVLTWRSCSASLSDFPGKMPQRLVRVKQLCSRVRLASILETECKSSSGFLDAIISGIWFWSFCNERCTVMGNLSGSRIKLVVPLPPSPFPCVDCCENLCLPSEGCCGDTLEKNTIVPLGALQLRVPRPTSNGEVGTARG